MFRKHAVLLNTVPHLELLVCDEGHRLKNIGGTKTMQALRYACLCQCCIDVILSVGEFSPQSFNQSLRKLTIAGSYTTPLRHTTCSACKAFRRIVLSGTPVQNDLDELYAVTSFVAPGYLGEMRCP